MLDQIRAFDQKIVPLPPSSLSQHQTSPAQNNSLMNDSSHSRLNKSSSVTDSSYSSISFNTTTSSLSGLGISSHGMLHDEWAETSYLGINILVNILSSHNLEICAQASAKINTILHSKQMLNCEEACYLIASVEQVMRESISQGDDQHYAFLIPIMKSLIDKCHNLLLMNVQVPNMPFGNVSPTFYEDFREYCQGEEWRVFVERHVRPLREQYLAMTINPCQMNMKFWWNTCHEALMVAIHKRNRALGEAKIKFEDTIYSGWREREKHEMARYQNYLIQLKRTNLNLRKYLHSTLRFFTSERGAWNEK
jgi:hypothetical protein